MKTNEEYVNKGYPETNKEKEIEKLMIKRLFIAYWLLICFLLWLVSMEGWPMTGESFSEFNRQSRNFQHSPSVSQYMYEPEIQDVRNECAKR